MRIVVDASVVIARLFHDEPNEPDGKRALAIFMALDNGAIELVQPPHWLVEAAAVCAKRAPNRAPGLFDLLSQYEIKIADEPRIYSRAIDLAIRHKVHVFDAMYHAVAMETAAILVTADQRYFDTVRSEGHIKMLHQFTLN
jgi:predicted nucleic acid-binding protein